MSIMYVVIKVFGFFFGADGLWTILLFPRREELDESPEQRICQFLYILRPLFAAGCFVLVWLFFARGLNAFVDFLGALGVPQNVRDLMHGGLDWAYQALQACNDWIYKTFWPIHFLFPYNLTFRVSAIGLYIGCYRVSKRKISKPLVALGRSCLDAHPALKKALDKIYTINQATNKVTLSPKWERVKRGLSGIITANFLLVYVLNILTDFATSLLQNFLPINRSHSSAFFA